MSLIEEYETAISQGKIHDSLLQRQVLNSLQKVADELKSSKQIWYRRNRKKSVKGIYLYGPVGGGKTYLMDLFYHYVPEVRKSRFHFHHFMQQVDAKLRNLQGQKDPLQRIAADIAKTTHLLFLDEFLVHNIADAMILSELLQALIFHKVVLVATSNTRPDDLYLNGLQRARFLPAIDLIKSHCELIVLTDNRDYRLGRTPLLQAYLYPLNDATDALMAQQFSALAMNEEYNTQIVIQNRLIPCVKCSQRLAWFKFSVLCNVPRSQLDYLEIASRFDTVFISDMPTLDSNHTGAILLMQFIDVMYDQKVRVILSSEVALHELYGSEKMPTAFQRTLSRLQEMQSLDYLHRSRAFT